MAEKRLTIKQFREAYRVMKARGWTVVAGTYCNKLDKQACPIMALALSQRKRFPTHTLDRGTYACNVVHKTFGVSYDYIKDFINGVDGGLPSNDKDKAFALGIRVRELFINKKAK